MTGQAQGEVRKPGRMWRVLGLAFAGLVFVTITLPGIGDGLVRFWNYAEVKMAPPPTCSLSVLPRTLNGPGAVTVRWDSNSSTGSIDEIGSLSWPSGTAKGHIARTTTFVATFENAAGVKAECSATVSVLSNTASSTTTADDIYYDDYYGTDGNWYLWSSSAAIPTCKLAASPMNLPTAGKVRISWDSTNAASGKIDGLGILAGAAGYGTTLISKTTTFVATFANKDGDRTQCSVTIRVASGGPAR